ncbi:MAG: hypothetical protein LIP09_05525 [Bacteroidales bacterium]|nr:hypothetical protein [Bacteroidales bacterium]
MESLIFHFTWRLGYNYHFSQCLREKRDAKSVMSAAKILLERDMITRHFDTYALSDEFFAYGFDGSLDGSLNYKQLRVF